MQEFKLNTMQYDSLSTLVLLLHQLALDLNLENFLHYYWRNHPQLISRPETVRKIDSFLTINLNILLLIGINIISVES